MDSNHVVKINYDCATHDINYFLGNPLTRSPSSPTSSTTNNKVDITCTQCKFLCDAINEVKKSIV